ncbi:peptidyl-prolyl cis-trans isomerase [Flaviflagellibacter deserti]|uniref:Parvulin-like PPIase n=1 Tax=Flaviflagellibacter deserti TaxID=2267266 RepID=A0ABV9Z0W0_9HYPH
MKLLQEPLVHFVAAGTVLFAVYSWLNKDSVEIAGVPPVRIGEGELRWVEETWSRQWLRSPSKEELSGFVAELVNEELLAREALEMGLDKDDTIIRRRLAQKLKFIVDDTARLGEPTDDVLRAYYEKNLARFTHGATVSFVHAFFNTGTRSNAEGDARAILKAGPSPNAGDRFLLGNGFPNADAQAVSNVFGPDFARELFRAVPGTWSGPIKSAYGYHLALIDRKNEAAQLPFNEVRDKVVAAWRVEKQDEAYAAYIARLREKYGVEFDQSVKALLDDTPAKSLVAK